MRINHLLVADIKEILKSTFNEHSWINDLFTWLDLFYICFYAQWLLQKVISSDQVPRLPC